MPAPTLPNWIAEYGPKGEADTLAQIRVIFKEPLIPLEQLESSSETEKLKYFRIEPALAGHFRFLTPRMVGFQADQAIPKASRVKVIVGAGLTDLKNNRLDRDLAWTFTSEPVSFTDLPGGQSDTEQEPLERTPTLKVTANTELDAASLAKNTALVAADHASTAVTATLAKMATPPPDSNAAESFDPSLRNYIYDIKPVQALESGAVYSLVISPGVQSARGNLPSSKTFRGSFRTYGPLELVSVGTTSTDPQASSRFVHGDPVLHFNNGLDGASASKEITISPAPRTGTTLLHLSDGDRNVPLNPWSLEPARSYTVKLGADLKDKFGQTLGKDQTIIVITSDLSPDFWAPTGLNIFARTNRLRLNFSAVNLADGRYQAAYRPLAPAQTTAFSGGGVSDIDKLLPAADHWPTFPARGSHNQILTLQVPVQSKLGGNSGLLAYGARAASHGHAEYYGVVGITNLGVFAQLFPQAAYVAVQHLADGSPAAGAAVDVYREKTSTPCASTRTDAQGAAQLALTDVERCSTGAPSDAAPSLFVIAREASDWAYTAVDDSTGYSYGMYLGWSNGKPISYGRIFSDRQMYQPSEHAMLTGAAYYLQNGTLKRDAHARYSVSITDSNGVESKLGTATSDEYGLFSLRWNIKPNQPLGFYSIKAVGDKGIELDGDLRVAEFKPPNFNASLALSKKFAAIGTDVSATGTSDYLFGSPLQGANARFYVTRQQTTVQPKGWDEYSFGRQWFWPDESPTVPTDVLQQDTTLDNQGHASQTVHVADDVPYPMDYRVDFEVSDVSHLSVSDSKTFTALPSDVLIGLQHDFVGDEKTAFPVKVIVTDPNGAASGGKPVHVELQFMVYSAATQLIEGGESARNAVKYTTLDQADVTPGNTPATIKLTPPKPGAYRIKANFAGAKSDATETDTQIWISGPEAVRWSAENPSQLKISLDKPTYHTGDTATALLQSPYPQADVYFSVVRQNVLYKSFQHVSGGAPRIQFRITPSMLPNAAV
ncbi:MAG: alpha-2-macroglobulin family protein, partial [Candidatus Eremiobacteraeota bacterium]|nr:alpha-2-macroglobulin family protein [Candidatus Eremiobacteraeota bacterium]